MSGGLRPTVASSSPLLRRAAPPAADGVTVRTTPADAGWQYVSIAAHRLAAGGMLRRAADGDEVAVFVLEGRATVRAGEREFTDLGTRETVFDGPPAPLALVEPGLPVEISSDGGGLVVVASAPGGAVRSTRVIDPADVLVEARGAGNTARRINHLLPPAAEAGRLIAFEVFTPGGNWSSYPPHKHDTQDPPRETYLEEIYFYRFARPTGFAVQRVYTADGSLDETITVHDGDLVLVPRGYHVVGAAAGYDCYYLNVMAGHSRDWRFTVDPDHAWLMDWDPGAPRRGDGPWGRWRHAMTETTMLTPLQQTVRLGTDLWNDSSDPAELEYALANGAVGATSNPPITLDVLRKEPDRWRARARELSGWFPTWSETEITWQIYEEIALRGAAVLLPTFERTDGAGGRLSIQTDPALYRDTDRMLAQGRHFAGLAPNLQVKFPTTRAGLAAIEEATYRGVNINATVSFSVPQALAVGEAVERALDRRAAEGSSTTDLHPVCTIMVGRLDDWLKVVAERDGMSLTPGVADWAGVAAFKRAYGVYRERGFRTRLLAAAYRHHLHWSQLVGGDVVLSMPHAWQVRFNASSVEVRSRIDEPVDPAILRELEALPEFRRAYEPEGLAIDEFDGFGATARTLRQFIVATTDLVGAVRDFVLPNPDVRG